MLAFNPYNLRARVQPILVAWLPFLAMPLVLDPDASFDWTAVRWLALYFVFATLLVQLGRDRGKRLEKKIYKDIGCKPSMAMLRHRDSRIGQHTKKRYVAFLDKNIQDLRLPSPDEERNSPGPSDEKYRSAVVWLLAQTTNRDQFPLVFEENINYGFRRNIWALKRPVLWTNGSAITFAGIGYGCQGAILGQWLQGFSLSSHLLFFWVVIALIHSYFFAFVIKRRWVREQSETFARRLLAACDRLETIRIGGDRTEFAAKHSNNA